MCETTSQTPSGMAAFPLCSQLLTGPGAFHGSSSPHPQRPCFSHPLLLSYGLLISFHLTLTQALTCSGLSSLPVFISCTCFIPASLSFQDLCLISFFSGSFVFTLLKRICVESFFFFFLSFFFFKAFLSCYSHVILRQEGGRGGSDGQVGPLHMGREGLGFLEAECLKHKQFDRLPFF